MVFWVILVLAIDLIYGDMIHLYRTLKLVYLASGHSEKWLRNRPFLAMTTQAMVPPRIRGKIRIEKEMPYDKECPSKR